MYRIYYSYKAIGDVLIIVFDELAYPDTVISKGNVTSLYTKGKLVGINIFNISDIVKIHADGLLHFVNPELVKVINTILKNANVATLDKNGYSIENA